MVGLRVVCCLGGKAVFVLDMGVGIVGIVGVTGV